MKTKRNLVRLPLVTTGILMLFALCPLQSKAQLNPEKKIIASLSPGETIANGENCFLLSKNPEYISFVTVSGSGNSKQYYCYGKDGKKTGPVAKPDESYWSECQDLNLEDCIANHEPNVPNPEEYIDYGTMTVKFQGKSYGPFGQILMFYLSDNEQNFFAVALSAEMKIMFFDKNNRKVELNGMPDEVIVSPDGQKAYAVVKGSLNPFDPESMQKMMANPEEMNNPKINLIGIDGSKFGPFTNDSYTDAWFISSGKLVIYNNSEISLEGRLLFRSEEHISKCDLWVSNSGKDYAWADYEHLYFSDGTKYTAPLSILYVQSGATGTLKWISLEDGKNLTYYKRAF